MDEREHRRPHAVVVGIRKQPAIRVAAAAGLVLLALWGLAFWRVLEPALVGYLAVVPVVAFATRFGRRGGVGAGVTAALLAGPFGGPASDDAVLWAVQAIALAGVGFAVGALSTAFGAQLAREDEIERRERALSSQRVALVQVVSHELRTPLTVIRGSMETLRSRPEAVAPRFQGLVAATQRSASRLEEMVGMMLAAADDLDIGLAQRTDVPVEDLVHHAAISIRQGVADRLRLDVPDDAHVETVEAYLWLALRCLLDNAVRFSPVDEPIDVAFVRERDRAVITLRDHGPGLPDGFVELAFEPFTQADATLRRSRNGLGIGLYTARRLARRLGGDIELESKEHQGVTARVYLPQPALDVTDPSAYAVPDNDG